MVCPLSAIMSSVPEDNKFIVQVAAVWKSGWAEMDWGIDFEVHQYSLLIYFRIKNIIFPIVYNINKLIFVEINSNTNLQYIYLMILQIWYLCMIIKSEIKIYQKYSIL